MFKNVFLTRRKVFLLFAFLAACSAIGYTQCSAAERETKIAIRWLYPPDYYQGTDFSEGRVWVREQVDNPHVVVNDVGPDIVEFVENAAWALLDDRGNVLKKGFVAEDIFEYRAGLALFASPNWETRGVVDRSGEVVFRYGEEVGYTPLDGSGLFVKKGENNLYGIIDMSGKWIVPPRYEDALRFQEGLCGVKKNGKWGFIDKTGRVAIGFKFGEIEEGFWNGVCHVRMFKKANNIDGRSGLIDKRGRWVLEPTYSWVFLSERTRGDLIGVRKDDNGKVGFVDKKGNWVIGPRYFSYAPDNWPPDHSPSRMYEFNDNGVAAIAFEGLDIEKGSDIEYGIIDESGRLVAKTGKIPAYYRGRFAVSYNEKGETILIDKKGKRYLLPAEVQEPFYYVTATDDNIFTATNSSGGAEGRVGYFVVVEEE